MHAEFSERYEKHLLDPNEAMAVNTQTLVIRWVFQGGVTSIPMVDDLRHKCFKCCETMHSLMNSAIVRGVYRDRDGFIRLELNMQRDSR
jgi:hypothetical protein